MMRELRSIPNWFPSSAELMHSIWSWNFAIAIEYLLQGLVLELTTVCRSSLKPGVQLSHVACMIGYQPMCLTTLSLGFKVITWILRHFKEFNLALNQAKCSFSLCLPEAKRHSDLLPFRLKPLGSRHATQRQFPVLFPREYVKPNLNCYYDFLSSPWWKASDVGKEMNKWGVVQLWGQFSEPLPFSCKSEEREWVRRTIPKPPLGWNATFLCFENPQWGIYLEDSVLI